MSDRSGSAGRPLQLYHWSDGPIVALLFVSLASGFGQFGVVAALGDVAKTFGNATHGTTIAEQAGLSGTVLGVGLAIIRVASLGALPLCGLADRFGRRTMLLVTVGVGLAFTVVASASPGYWWFVALFALGRPFLTATNGLAQVAAAEETASPDRASAVALVVAGYGIGAGALAILHSLASGTLGFRGLFALALVPLVALPVIARSLREPDRFTVARAGDTPAIPVLGAVAPRFRRRLAVVVALAFAVSVITGPADTFVFLYAQNIVHLSGLITAAMVAGAGVTGLGGLLAGRWLADHVGRRPTGALGMVGIAVCGVVTYSGPKTLLVAGYVLGIFAGALLGPAGGALLNELFPTSVRASVAGWWLLSGVVGAVVGLLLFGAVADIGNRFSLAADVIFLPVALAAALFWAVPETRGREPEELWPDL
ncbi:MAG: MFS transporter [Acidimicrobiales bacterium]